MKCRSHEADLSALMDGELSATEERVLRDHLAGCPECRARLEVLERLSATLGAYRDVTDVMPSTLFADRVVARAGRPVVRRVARRSPVRRFPVLFPLPLKRFPVSFSLAAAAALLLIAGASIFYLVGAATPVAVEIADARTDLDLYRARAAAIALGDASAHLDLAAWCAERGLAPEAARETFRAWGADPDSPRTRRPLADLLLSPGWDAPEVRIEVAALDLGSALPAPEPRVRFLNREEMLDRFGFSRDEVWGVMLTQSAREELRDQRELASILADRGRRRVALAGALAKMGDNPAAALLLSLEAGDVKTYGALTVVALNDGTGDPGVLPLDVAEALAAGVLTIQETSDGVFAVNDHPNRPIYFAPGDILVGARQDRVVRRPTLVSAKTGPEQVPVLCCEKNRSWGPTDQFAKSPGIAPNGIRHLLMGLMDNQPVWDRISAQLAALEAGYGDDRNTGSLKSVYRRGRGVAALASYREALLPALTGRRSVGFLVYRGDEFLGGDVFATHALLTQCAPRYLAAYVLESLWEKGTTTPTPASARPKVRKVLDSVTSAVWLSRRGAATGREYEFLGKDNGVSGMALVPAAGVRPIHISLFPTRKPRPVGGEDAKKDSTPPPGRSTARNRGTSPPPDDDRGKVGERKELEKTRERRKKARTPPKKLEPPKSGRPGSHPGGGRKVTPPKSGGGASGGGVKLPE